MRFCHECGGIVTPEDTFCSYCGITLQPVAAAPNAAESAAPSPQPEFDEPAAVEIAAEPATDSRAETPNIGEPLSETANQAAVVENQTDLALKAALLFEAKPPTDSPDLIADQNAADAVAAAVIPADLNQELIEIAPFRSAPPENPAIENAVINEPWFDEKPNSQLLVQPAIQPDDKADDKADDEPATIISQQIQVAAEPQEPEETEAPNFDLSLANFSFQPKPAANLDQIIADVANEPQTDLPQVDSEDGSAEDLQETLIGQKINHNLEIEPTIKPSIVSDSEAAQIVKSELSAEREEVLVVANSAIETDSAKAESAKLAAPPASDSGKSPDTPGGRSARLRPLGDGTLLNRRYEIVRRIGGGGMGAVYLAKDRNLGGVARAVKEMIQAYVDESQQEKAVQDFRRESLLLSQLEHPSIPTIFDYFYDEDAARFYLVMKYIAGGDLSNRLRLAQENKLDEGSVTEWAMHIADVLDYLHNQQPPIVYRDLKPSNIMLDALNGKAMLVDFGIARWVKKEEKGVTAVGTMGYAPPELFAGNAEPRSDLYSLGATMFHLLTGADPQSNPLLIFDFTKNPRPRDVNPNLSVEIEDILLRAVEYNASLRFESAAKMRDALRQHLERLKAGQLTFERRGQHFPITPEQPKGKHPIVPAQIPAQAQAASNLVFCGFCGEKIVATDMFCAYCGAPQQAMSAGGSKQLEQTMLSAQPNNLGASKTQATARLVVLGTQQLDEPVFALEKENNLIGREDRRSNIFPEIDLTKYDDPGDARISRRHARIWREGADFLVEDLKSANGTILIGGDNSQVRLQPNQPHALQNGDKLKLGKTTLLFYAN